jgi:hypothetical protein
LCMMNPREETSQQCIEYWRKYQASYAVNMQIQFCNRFQMIPDLVLICDQLEEVFKEICITQPQDALPQYCEQWFVNNHTDLQI